MNIVVTTLDFLRPRAMQGQFGEFIELSGCAKEYG